MFRRLRDAIVDGTFAPGEQLRDAEVAAWLSVSRTPVREAMLRLAEAGLVVALPGRSTMVSPLHVRDLRDARDVVAALHGVAVREAMSRFTRPDIDAMREANERFRAALDEGDVDAALRADDVLHAIPVAVAANRALAAVLDQYTPVLRRAERMRFSTTAGRASIARHEQLIESCRTGDSEGAAAVNYDIFHSLSGTEIDQNR
ncbi:GntR family transcriptional regulator [Nocardioides sp. cx-173]|uniref:GntR family transcriptional regulator n=1 Tax=Nocardioides sp. cx-173 TaxID=2898796 RepID=UPI001E5421CF|nr:GntR family transcriptional regulator [Nocardioides sp. cx-173]MCD4525954.1 GntR family transcriptional regulator [Nocardioides sp. cx-173]UGB43651.1 GntR family transcriptional regulator [Nocardioides sp. cx-173]